MPVLAAPVPDPQSPPNRRVPDVEPVPQSPAFSDWPTDEEIFRARVFSEPLVPIGPATPGENAALARGIMAYLRAGGGESTADLEALLEARTLSPWRASLRMNLGSVYRRHRLLHRALFGPGKRPGRSRRARPIPAARPSPTAPWESSLSFTPGSATGRGSSRSSRRSKAATSAAPLARISTGAKQGLWEMKNQPERAIPLRPAASTGSCRARSRLRRPAANSCLPSTSRGQASAKWARSPRELSCPCSRRSGQGQPRFSPPALVHRKAGHFAATRQRGGWPLPDPGSDLGPGVLDEPPRVGRGEPSGYMLVPGKSCYLAAGAR